jgi:lipid-binding SYLF domain-containing protein
MDLSNRSFVTLVFITLLASLSISQSARAASAEEIDIKVDGALTQFKEEVTGGAEFLTKAKGVLVFPSVLKGGFIVGAEYGEGALRVDNKSIAYYSIASASLGLQAGAQEYAIVMVFLDDAALKKFQESKGWEAGVDGSVAIAKWGAGKDINTQSFQEPIVGFVFSNKGLMAGISLEGSKVTKLDR